MDVKNQNSRKELNLCGYFMIWFNENLFHTCIDNRHFLGNYFHIVF